MFRSSAWLAGTAAAVGLVLVSACGGSTEASPAVPATRASAADGGAKHARDAKARVTFRLEGTRLHVSVDPDAPRSTKSLMRDKLTFVCGKTSELAPYLPSAHVRDRFPRGRNEVTVDLGVDISREVGFCGIEGAFGDEAYGYFVPIEQIIADTGKRLGVASEADVPLPDEDSSPACSNEAASPLSVKQVIDALRRHRFTVYPDTTSADCSAEDIVMDVTNILFDGPHENIASHAEISAREGHLGCAVRRGPIYGGESEIQTLEAEVDKFKLVLANVECTIYLDRERRAIQLANLKRALLDLQRDLD